jgi:acyl CoA:acetate/3-ketoacid CoA transferase
MDFIPLIADDLKIMDQRIFEEGLMGLRAQQLSKDQ